MRIALAMTLCVLPLLISCDKVKFRSASSPPSESTSKSAPAVQPTEVERVAAKPGVTGKGEGYGGGIITEPARQYFQTKERVVFEIQIPHALQLYKALNDDKPPTTHDEFMEKIVKANNINLPELPPGQRYVYDPEKEELFVERPAQ